MSARLKLATAPALDGPRAELAGKISRVLEAEERLSSNRSRIEALEKRVWGAQTALDNSEAVVAKTKEARLEHLACDSRAGRGSRRRTIRAPVALLLAPFTRRAAT